MPGVSNRTDPLLRRRRSCCDTGYFYGFTGLLVERWKRDLSETSSTTLTRIVHGADPAEILYVYYLGDMWIPPIRFHRTIRSCQGAGDDGSFGNRSCRKELYDTGSR